MSLTDYSSMEGEIRNAPEPKILPKGKEVKVRIIQVRSGISEKEASNGARWYSPVMDVPDDPMVKEFNTFLWDPLTQDKLSDPKQKARNLDTFKKFIQCFKIDLSKPFDWETDLVGKTGWIITGIQTDDQYGDKNTVSKYVTGPAGAPGKSAAAATDEEPGF